MVVKDELEGVLKDLKALGDVEATAIVSKDGLPIAVDLSSGVDAESFAALSATILGAAETAMSEVMSGSLDRVIIESEGGKIVATAAGPEALLVVMTSPNAKLGLILLKINKAKKRIMEILG